MADHSEEEEEELGEGSQNKEDGGAEGENSDEELINL